MTSPTTTMRRFQLHRGEDITGVSGTGNVAEGVQFTDGTIAMRWLSKHPSTVIYDRGLVAVIAIHLHHGASHLVWLDDER